MAYDRTIVVFSPDGRLLQVEYARQMVKNGTTAIGIRTSEGVLLGAVKSPMPLAVSYKKIYEIDDHIAVVSAGSLADARNLVDMARVKAQVNKITYSEPISVASMTKHLCDRMHIVTQYAGVRPYGVGLLIGGMDDSGARLFETEPSGTLIEWHAQVIGRGAEKARPILKKEYKENMDPRAAQKLLLKALQAGEKDAGADSIDAVLVTKKGTKDISLKNLKGD
jgi:proteasome alpha subunit